MIEILIETLTGTCFELRVSPFETIMAVKSKIQRMEGIPMTHQFLIFQNVELKDENRLVDYSIISGSKLKLVLAMRGGPINTHKIAVESGEDDFSDYMDVSQTDFLDTLTSTQDNQSSNKQITLLVYRDGDQLNFFRVVDRGDGTLTPLSETGSEESGNFDEESESATTLQQHQQKWQNIAKMIENNVTAAKMKKLTAKTKKMSIKSQTSLSAHGEYTPVPPRMAKPATHGTMSNTSRRLFKQKSTTGITVVDSNVQPTDPRPQTSAELGADVVVSGNGDLIKVNQEHLKPKLNSLRSVTEATDLSNLSATCDQPRSPRTRRLMHALSESRKDMKRKSVATATSSYVRPPPAIGQGLAFNRHEMYLRSYGLLPSPDLPNGHPDDVLTTPTERRLEPNKKLHETPHGVKYSSISGRYNHYSSASDTTEWNRKTTHPEREKSTSAFKNEEIKTNSINRELYSNYDRLRRKYGVLPPTTVATDDMTSATNCNWQSSSYHHSNAVFQRSSSALGKTLRHPVATGQQVIAATEIDMSDASLPSPYHAHRSVKIDNQLKDDKLNLNQSEKSNSAHGEKISRQSVREVVDFVNKAIDTSILCGSKSPLKDHRGNSAKQKTNIVGHKNMLGGPSASGRRSNLPSLPTATRGNDHFLPPVKNHSKKKYCFLCRKKTGLASSFICRCGNNFCTMHRYAESHQCTFDYKTQGRKLLKENNPLVSAPKLPKI